MDFHLLISVEYSFHLLDVPEFPNRHGILLLLA